MQKICLMITTPAASHILESLKKSSEGLCDLLSWRYFEFEWQSSEQPYLLWPYAEQDLEWVNSRGSSQPVLFRNTMIWKCILK